MKQIKKTKEPQSFSEWKAKANSDWKPAWENLQNPEKVDILEKLIEDQHGICCYCEARISVESAHIEHIVPRSIDIRKRLSFSNLLASCQKETQKGDPLTCGKSRGDWYDKDFYLNPCDENSRKEIIYLLDGNVTVQNKNFKIFIEKINLNIESKKEHVLTL
ncbi:uncharacterized protein (TIGR02646 family) [Zymomonas mobilis]|uniref:retron system putative HNH endonuclease n=1 Tax=Zymomonas mobilis TaxID=542 RepID=UPI001152EFB3|nr:retron system putative HNH endonuclease [Zymomonas mobilis]TQL24988.1 uncharacterized protein (TIGR02646 family) [Zymomonas mobilis]